MAVLIPKLSVEKLSVSYKDSEILKNLNFEVYEGEFLSILGSSGCGKTTLLRVLIGLMEQSSGRILLDGKDISSAPPSERKMGLVFQNHALFAHMNVLDNVSYALHFSGYSKSEAKQIALKMLDTLELSDYADRRPAKLSIGQQQRVAIARTLVLKPDIILFDEPMSALDADIRLSLRKEIKEIQRRTGCTIIYVTHDQEEAFALSDRIMVLKEGEIVQIDTPSELLSNPTNDYVSSFVGKNLRDRLDLLKGFAETVEAHS